MKKYKILIFDLDDTLIDNYENVKFGFKKMIAEKHEVYTDEDFKRFYETDKAFWHEWQNGNITLPDHLKDEVGKKSPEFLDWVRAQRILRYYNFTITLSDAIKLNNIYMEALKDCVIPIEGAYETLKYLSSKYTIVVATNGPSIATLDKLKKINCIEFVSHVLSADMFGYMKPSIEFFKGITKTLDNYNLDDYLVIGDSLKSDVGFAKNANVDSCLFNKYNYQLDKENLPTYVIDKLIELIDIL